ncbi:MAG: serine hydrolase [Arsenophonus sp. NC-PE1-MAG3]
MRKSLIKKINHLTCGLNLLFIFFSFMNVYANELQVIPQLDVKAYVLMDYHSGKVLTSNNSDERLDPASLTKIMTSYVVGQAIKAGKISINDLVIIGKDAWVTGNPVLRGSSLMFLKPGDRVSVLDLNRGIVIQSGNDACIALANYVSGSQTAFVDLMNQYVTLLGLKNTHFKTVHGLDSKGQFSTAHDMAVLAKALIRDVPDEYLLHGEKVFIYNKIKQFNRHRLLWSKSLQVDGIKTGHTSRAGYNLITSATNGEMRLIAVVLGASSDSIRFIESEKLLNWGFRFYSTIIPITADKPFTTEKVWYGNQSTVLLGTEKDVVITISKGREKDLKATYSLNSAYLKAPLSKNQVVGTIDFFLNDKLIDKYPLVVKEAIKQGEFLNRLWDYIVVTISGWQQTLFN